MSEPRASVKDHRVLVAGPDDFLRRNLVLFLQREGLDVCAVNGGREALFLANQLRPSVVLLSSGLTDIPALGVCQCIREMPSLAGVPTIVVNLESGYEFEALARSSGAYAVLRMPLDARDIIIKVANALMLVPSPGDAATVTIENGGSFSSVVTEARAGREIVLDFPASRRELLAGHKEGVAASFRFVDAAATRTTWAGVLLAPVGYSVEARLHRIIDRVVRREAFRAPIDQPARYKFEGDAYRWGRVVDLSVAGLRLAGTGNPLPATGALAELSFTLGPGGRPLRVAASARWSRAEEGDAFSCGLAFHRLPEDLRDHIVAYLFETAGEAKSAG